jgi:hypothetical protein
MFLSVKWILSSFLFPSKKETKVSFSGPYTSYLIILPGSFGPKLPIKLLSSSLPPQGLITLGGQKLWKFALFPSAWHRDTFFFFFGLVKAWACLYFVFFSSERSINGWNGLIKMQEEHLSCPFVYSLFWRVGLLWVTLVCRDHTAHFVKATLTFSHSTNISWIPTVWETGTVGKGSSIYWASVCSVILYAYLICLRNVSHCTQRLSIWITGFSHARFNCLSIALCQKGLQGWAQAWWEWVLWSIKYVFYKCERGQWWHICYVNIHLLIKLTEYLPCP